MMKRLVSYLFFASLFLIALALVLPGFINWNNHKDLIIAQIEPYVQRKIQVAGDVSFKILPNPQILLQDVSVDNFLKLKTLEAKVRLKPLLEGKFLIETVNLVEPELTFETKEDGTASWKGVIEETQSKKIGSAASVQLNQVTLSDGKLHYINRITGAEWHIDKFNLRVSADTLLGPYRVTGDMLYNDKVMNIEMGSGKYDSAAPVPVRVTLMPVDGLPEVKFSGVADLKSAFDLQGELSIEQGTLASLFDAAFLKDIPFLNETAGFNGVLEIKGSEIKLTDIKAKIGQKGGFTGKVTAQLARGQKPVVTADLNGHDLKIFGKSGFLQTPEKLDLRIDLKGERLVWNTLTLPSASVTANSNAKEWVVKKMSVDMAGKSAFKLSGLVTPKDKTASMKLDLSSDDLSQTITGLPFKKIALTGNLDISTDKISLYNFEATPDGGKKLSGVINIDRKSEKFAADMNVTGNVAGMDGFSLKGKVADKTLEGDISADKIDFSDFSTGFLSTLNVKSKKIVWRQNEVADAEMKLETTGKHVKVTGLKGKMWGGNLAADVDGENGAGNLKGKLTDADLDQLRILMELDGFTVGKGDIEFDLKDDGSMEKMFHSISGDLKIKANELTVDKFDFTDLSKTLDDLKSPPDDLKDIILKSIKSGDGVFKNVDAALKLGGGKFTFDGVKLSNEQADVSLKGEYDIGPEKYVVTADVKPKSDIPAFAITAPGYGLETAAFKDYIIKNNPVEVAPAVLPPPPVLEALPITPEEEPPTGEQPPMPEVPDAQSPETGADPVQGILERLDTPEELETQEVEPVVPATPLHDDMPVEEGPVEEGLIPEEILPEEEFLFEEYDNTEGTVP